MSDFDYNKLWANIQAFYASSDKSLIARAPELVYNKDFWDGFVLGAQDDNTDTSTMCYTSYNALYNLVNTADIEFLTYAISAVNKGETPTDLGFLTSNFEALTEFSLVFFNVYSFCYIELLLIQIGKITASNSGAGNFLLTVGVSLYEYFYNGSGNVTELDKALQGNDYGVIGKLLAAVVKELLDWQVPTYQVNTFQKAS